MDKNTVLKLAPKVLKRMEYGIDVFYLFNLETDEIWTGNESVELFISHINGKKTVQDLIITLNDNFKDYSNEEIYESIKTVFEELIQMKFLEIVK